jgi:hypothetical protein
MVSAMRVVLSLFCLVFLTQSAGADDVLDGWMRRGSVYQRTEMDEGTARSCAALCDGDAMCQSWVYTRAGLNNGYTQCALLSAAPTPSRSPGRVTGLSRRITERIEAAATRLPTAHEVTGLRATGATQPPNMRER